MMAITLADGSVGMADADGVAEALKPALRELLGPVLTEVKNQIRHILRDTRFLVHLHDGDKKAYSEPCRLRGIRRKQWEWFCDYKRRHPGEPVTVVADKAVDAVRGSGGFTHNSALPRYACYHKSWWTPLEGDTAGSQDIEAYRISQHGHEATES